MKKRTFLTGTAAIVASLTPAMRASVWAAGSDAPEKKEVKVGFIPLMSEEEAFASLRSLAMQRGVRLGEAAQQVIDVFAMLG